MSINNYNDIVAVVMAGGRSKRMGLDKGLIKYKDKAQRYYMADMLSTIFDNVAISVPFDFVLPKNSHYTYIKDVVADSGPLGGLYSLFKEYPNKSILVIATDMPDVDVAHIINLLEKRDIDSIATCYKNDEGFIEPLFAIWESVASKRIEQLVKENKLSMKMILKDNNAKIISTLNDNALLNINTIEEKNRYLRDSNK